MRIRRKSHVAALLLTLAGLLIVWLAFDEFAVPKVAPYQTTNEWAMLAGDLPDGVPNPSTGYMGDMPVEDLPGVLLRTTSGRSPNLLIKHSRSGIVYLYDTSTKNIQPTSEDEWNKVGGEASVCRRQIGGDYNKMINVMDTWRDHTIKYAGGDLKTYGRYALTATESPTHTRVAVLSAYGPRKPSFPGLIPGLGGSEPAVYGRRYVQVMGLDSGEPSGETVRLTKTDHADNDRLCWSSDENFLIVYKSFWIFSVIETQNQ